MKPKTISDNLIRIYDAAYAPGNWQSALDTVEENTRASAVYLYALSPSDHVSFATSVFSSEAQKHRESMAEYDRRFSVAGNTGYDDIGSEFLHRREPCTPVLDTDIWTAEWLDQRPEVLFMRKNMNWNRQFFFNLSRDLLMISGMLIKYGTDIETIPQEDIRAASILAPHYSKALDLNRWAHGLHEKYAAVLAVLDHFDIAIALANEDGSIILKNRQATDLFAERDGLWADQTGRLISRDPDLTARISSAISEVARTASGQNTIESIEISVPRGSSDNPLLLIASPLRDAEMELERGLTGCLLTIVDTDRMRNLRLDAFGAAYGFTPTEKRAARFLASGLTTPEIGEQMGVAMSTARTHVRSVFHKTRSSNRVNFVWKAVQFSPPIT